MRQRLIERMSWDEVADALTSKRLVIVPVGAFAKEHGRHLPMNTDALTAAVLSAAAADRLDAIVAPVVGFGFYPAFTRYAGSQSLSEDTFAALLGDILRGLADQGAKRLLLVNTGVSTRRVVDQAAFGIGRDTGARIVAVHTALIDVDIEWSQRQGGHADERETSLMLAIAADVVGMDRAEDAETDPSEAGKFPLSPWPDPQAHYSPSGVTGNPVLATAEKGRAYMEALVAEIVATGRRLA